LLTIWFVSITKYWMNITRVKISTMKSFKLFILGSLIKGSNFKIRTFDMLIHKENVQHSKMQDILKIIPRKE